MAIHELYRDCPRCGDAMPVDPGYVTWCHGCDFHVAGHSGPPEPVTFTSPLARLQQRHADHAVRLLVERLAARPECVSPSAGISLTVVLATLVLLAFLLFTAGWIWALVHVGWFWRPLVAVFGLGFTWLVLPRPGRQTRGRTVLTRDHAPATWEYLDLMAARCRTTAPELLAVDVQQNAFLARDGWRRSVLCIGLPLWAAMTWDERSFIIGHELGHRRARRGVLARLCWWARGVSIQTYRILSPATWRTRAGDTDGMGMVSGDATLGATSRTVIEPMLRALSAIPLAAAAMLDSADARARQERELLADRLAARAVGTDHAVKALVTTLRLASHRTLAISALIRGEDPWAALTGLPEAPPREVARLVRLSELTGHRYDASHPRTADRIELLRRSDAVPDTDLVPLDLQLRVDAELAEVMHRLRRRFEDALRES